MTISASDILSVTKSVTKEWTKQRKAEERGRSRSSRQYIYSDRVNFTDVAVGILPDAYRHASGDGKYSVSKRQLYYACREAFREQTERELEYNYFAGTLLVQYLNRHEEETAGWKLTADPRGTLTIPNADAEIRIPCGTLQVDRYLSNCSKPVEPLDIDGTLTVQWPSLSHGQRYQAVLYTEKEGFEPVLKEAKIAEKYDLAVLSCKGQSVVAARRYVDHACRVDGGVPLLVIHDFDKAGFEISQRLTKVSDWARENDRVAYEFANDINVTDLGLRLADVKKYGLAHERCTFQGRFARDAIATAAEKEFLRSGRRVELNAFSSPLFVEWLEANLSKHLKRRLIPDDAVLSDAYRRAFAVAQINVEIAKIREDAIEAAKSVKIPSSLRRRLQRIMKGEDDAWDAALYKLARKSTKPSLRHR